MCERHGPLPIVRHPIPMQHQLAEAGKLQRVHDMYHTIRGGDGRSEGGLPSAIWCAGKNECVTRGMKILQVGDSVVNECGHTSFQVFHANLRAEILIGFWPFA